MHAQQISYEPCAQRQIGESRESETDHYEEVGLVFEKVPQGFANFIFSDIGVFPVLNPADRLLNREI